MFYVLEIMRIFKNRLHLIIIRALARVNICVCHWKILILHPILVTAANKKHNKS